MNINFKKVGLFLILTFLMSWSYGFALPQLAPVLIEKWHLPVSFLGVIYMLFPMTAAVIVQKYIYKEPVRKSLGISFRFNAWFLAAWLLPPVFVFLTIGVSLLLPGLSFSPDMSGMYERLAEVLTPEQLQQMKASLEALPFNPIWLSLIQGMLAGCTINALLAFGEELGWRGFLQKELQGLGFWKSSLLIGFIWGVWHTPLILQGHNFPFHPKEGVFMMIIACMLMSPLFSYVTIKAKSVLASALMHGTLNGTYGLSLALIMGGNDLTTGGFGLPGIIALMIMNIYLLWRKPVV